MNIGDTVRDPKSGIIGTVTDIIGHHIMVKSDDYRIAVMFYDYEVVPVKRDDALIGCIRLSYGGAS